MDHSSDAPRVLAQPFAADPRPLLVNRSASLDSYVDHTLRFDFILLLGVTLATMLVDWLIVPDRVGEAIALKLALVAAPAGLGFALPEHLRGARKILLGASLVLLGCTVIHISGWVPGIDSLFHMMGAVLILGISTPVLPFARSEATAYVAVYILATGAELLTERGADSASFAVLAVLLIAGIAAWLLAARLWALVIDNFALAQLQEARMNDLARANRDLQQLASHDPLTGLANRRHCSAVFAQQYGEAPVGGRNHIAVFLLDLDRFKAFNDRHGHQMGDECLRAVSDTLAHTARLHGGVAARFGGEEFVVVTRVESVLGAQRIAEDLRVAIERMELTLEPGEGTASCTASIGVAVHRGDRAPDFAAMLKAADKAMYAAKHQGRNRVALA